MNGKKLTRSATDRKIAGVCGGVAAFFNVDATLVRLIAVVSAIFSAGTVLIVYFAAAIILPVEGEESSEWDWNNFDFTCKKKEATPAEGQPVGGPDPQVDEMMKGMETRALQREVEDLKRRLAQFEKGSE